MRPSCLGIDLGTSTTVAALTDDENTRVLCDAKGASVIPSVVAFPPNGGHLVGLDAKYRRPIDAENTLFSLKRIIGLPWQASTVQQFNDRYPFRLHDQQGVPCIATRAGNFTASQVLSHLVEAVRGMVAASGTEVGEVVVGVPSQFSAAQREAILQALSLGGFANAACVEEPYAIARSFLRENLGPSRLVAIYDLGGGTFDFALCEVRDGHWRELASGGDEYLGGDDVDQVCAQWVNQQVLEEFRWDVRTNPQAMTRLLAHCEQAKIQLSAAQSASVTLSLIEANDALRGQVVEINRALIDKLIADLVRRTFVVCDSVLATAGVRASDVADVYLAGGSSRIPSVQANVRHYFGKVPHLDANPEALVARGASILAHQRSKRATAAQLAKPNRRSTSRQPLALRVDVMIPNQGAIKKCLVTDLSRGGMFIELADPPQMHEELTVRLDAGHGILEIRSRVVHRATADDVQGSPRSTGVGIEFQDLTASMKEQIQEFVTQSAKLFSA